MENKFVREKHVYRKDTFAKISKYKANLSCRKAKANKPDRRQDFTVIGFWPDTMQRFASSFCAKNSNEAEEMCFRQYEGVAICGVLQGSHDCVDTHTYVHPK
jgi:hypothetical protein